MAPTVVGVEQVHHVFPLECLLKEPDERALIATRYACKGQGWDIGTKEELILDRISNCLDPDVIKVRIVDVHPCQPGDAGFFQLCSLSDAILVRIFPHRSHPGILESLGGTPVLVVSEKSGIS